MLVRLHLKNFKTHRDAEIELAPLTLVLGANGAGKSNMFDALRFLKAIGDGTSIRDAIEGHASPALITPSIPGIRGGVSEVTTFGSGSTVFSIQVSMAVAGDLLEYQVAVDASKFVVVREELRSKRHPGLYVFSTHPDQNAPEQDLESPVIYAQFHKSSPGRNPKRQFSRYEFVISQFKERKAESRLNEAVADLARAELASIRPLELRPEVLRAYSSLGAGELGEHGENFAAIVERLAWEANAAETRREHSKRLLNGLRTSRERLRAGRDERHVAQAIEPLDNQIATLEAELQMLGGAEGTSEAEQRRNSINGWLSQLTPRAVQEVLVQRAPTGEGIVAFIEDGHSEPVSARSLSDGTLRMAALAFVTLSSSGRRTLVVEELENGINPARLSLLIRMLERSVAESSDVQIIASTHSPGILDYASTETAGDAVVIGWDTAAMCSHPVRLRDLPALSSARKDVTLGELQAEGWLQFAADV